MKNKALLILKIVIVIVLFVWIVVVFSDYFRVRGGKDPMFCLSNTVKDYEDGSTKICVGAGYKAIKYERECLNATEFGPFVISERQCPEK